MRSNITGVEKTYQTAVALGEVPGATTWNKWGFNQDVDSAAEETVWSVGGVFGWIR